MLGAERGVAGHGAHFFDERGFNLGMQRDQVERPGERQSRGLVSSEEQRHDLVAELLSAHLPLLVRRRLQIEEQRVARCARRVDDGVHLGVHDRAKALLDQATRRRHPARDELWPDDAFLQRRHRAPQAPPVAAEAPAEQRTAHDLERERQHLAPDLDLRAARPARQHGFDLFGDGHAVALDALTLKTGLNQAALAAPEVPVAHQEPLAEELEVGRSLHERTRFGDEHLMHQIRIAGRVVRDRRRGVIKVAVDREALPDGTEHVGRKIAQARELVDDTAAGRRPGRVLGLALVVRRFEPHE